MTESYLLTLCSRRMHEAAGLISIEGSLEGLPREMENAPDSEIPVAVSEEAAAAKAARKKARKAKKAAAKANM